MDCVLNSYDDSIACVDLTPKCERKARKAHRCSDCGGTIQAGATYTYCSWVQEGDVHEFHGCASCRLVREVVRLRTITTECSNGAIVLLGYGCLEDALAEAFSADDRVEIFREAGVPLWEQFKARKRAEVGAE